MNNTPTYDFNLPPEENVIARNRMITACYAQLYQSQPRLYKWAGMAAFASFHIGENLKMWNWKKSGIKSFSETCRKKNRSIEDDFQIIRIINNRIFNEIGWVHLAFYQTDFTSFSALLQQKGRHPLIVSAFGKLNNARRRLKTEGYSESVKVLIWEANTEILWHEQSEVVQPLFDKLTDFFSHAMTFFASFDYKINHRRTSRIARSRFFLFITINGFQVLKMHGLLPKVTNLHHRWFWIEHDLLKNWKIIEADTDLIDDEIRLLVQEGEG